MTEQELIASIYDAFKHVSLEDGIGLYEADCLDDYMNPADAVYISWKQKDERQNWEKLLPLFLNETASGRVHSSNFFFMDAKGKRFHLPCYLLQDLDKRREGNNPLITAITFNPEKLTDFHILNDAQKQVIIHFLQFKMDQFKKEDNDFDFENYRRAKELFIKYFADNH